MAIMIVFLALLIPILAIVLDSELAKALAQRIGSGPLPSGDRATQERLSYLENEVERLSSEVGRLEEEGQFMHRLLTEKSSAEDDSPPDPDTPSLENGHRR